MATRTLMCLKRSANVVILRCLETKKQSHKICQFSTFKVLRTEEPPVKFSTSSAAKVSIGETTGINPPSVENRVRKTIILSSLFVFLLYFCVLREENDIDEHLAGNFTDKPEALELIDLKIKLAYCERNNLPTDKLKSRIAEIANKNMAPVFAK